MFPVPLVTLSRSSVMVGLSLINAEPPSVTTRAKKLPLPYTDRTARTAAGSTSSYSRLMYCRLPYESSSCGEKVLKGSSSGVPAQK